MTTTTTTFLPRIIAAGRLHRQVVSALPRSVASLQRLLFDRTRQPTRYTFAPSGRPTNPASPPARLTGKRPRSKPPAGLRPSPSAIWKEFPGSAQNRPPGTRLRRPAPPRLPALEQQRAHLRRGEAPLPGRVLRRGRLHRQRGLHRPRQSQPPAPLQQRHPSPALYLNLTNIHGLSPDKRRSSRPMASARNVSPGQRDRQSNGTTPTPRPRPVPRFPALQQDLYTAGLRLKSKPGALGPVGLWPRRLMHQFGDRNAVNAATTPPRPRSRPPRASSRTPTPPSCRAATPGPKGPWQPRLALTYELRLRRQKRRPTARARPSRIFSPRPICSTASWT